MVRNDGVYECIVYESLLQLLPSKSDVLSTFVCVPHLKPRLHVQTGLSNHSAFVQTNLKQWLDGQTASVALAMQSPFISLRASSRL